MSIRLRRGDTCVLSLADLADEAGVTLDAFQAGDVLQFTICKSFNKPFPLVLKSSDGGGITYTAGTDVGSVLIASTDWPKNAKRHLYGCVWDVQLTRGSSVTTLMSGTLDVLMDVTP